MRIYVAAKYEERARAAELIRELRNAGHEITYDWTGHPPDTPPVALPVIAMKDAGGAADADLTVVLWHRDLRGALVEMGVALGRRRPVIAVGVPSSEPCIFFTHPLVMHVGDDVEALASVGRGA